MSRGIGCKRCGSTTHMPIRCHNVDNTGQIPMCPICGPELSDAQFQAFTANAAGTNLAAANQGNVRIPFGNAVFNIMVPGSTLVNKSVDLLPDREEPSAGPNFTQDRLSTLQEQVNSQYPANQLIEGWRSRALNPPMAAPEAPNPSAGQVPSSAALAIEEFGDAPIFHVPNRQAQQYPSFSRPIREAVDPIVQASTPQAQQYPSFPRPP